VSDAELEIKTKAGCWKIRETEYGGLDIEFESDQPNGGYFDVKRDYDQDACVLIPRKRTPSCSGGG
jgi:hypothetical protein